MTQISPPQPSNPPDSDRTGIQWFDIATIGPLEGRPFADPREYYHRLPAWAQGKVTEKVWERGQSAAGMVVRFETEATDIWARWLLVDPQFDNSLRNPTSEMGLDLYARDPSGRWCWVKSGEPWKMPQVDKQLGVDLDPGLRQYMIYLPLRVPVSKVEVGLPSGAKVRWLPPRPRPIVYYGTSIVHGTGASRPGMAHAHITGRRLDRHLINFGFGGAACMEPIMADLMGTMDASIFVVDCLPNMSPPMVRERALPFVLKLRQLKPTVPIILVEDRIMTSAWIQRRVREDHQAKRRELRLTFQKLIEHGVPGIHYLNGEHLLGDDHEATNDASHPSDLGMMRQADIMTEVIRPLLLAVEEENPFHQTRLP
ncbi:MAG: hypothetical protein JJU36_15630 [Phycisphaeraceae bacterium]|nr:hypothetical protein [Phycisphaeraceae bacterium]